MKGSVQPCPAMQGWRDIGSPQCHDQTSNAGEDPTSRKEKKINKVVGSKNRASIFGVLDTHSKSQNKINRGPYLNIPLRHLPLSRLNLPYGRPLLQKSPSSFMQISPFFFFSF